MFFNGFAQLVFGTIKFEVGVYRVPVVRVNHPFVTNDAGLHFIVFKLEKIQNFTALGAGEMLVGCGFFKDVQLFVGKNQRP